MPIRGHSNVQGLGSVGVTPTLKKALLDRFEQRLGVKAPTSPGLDTMACMDAASRGEMRAALCLGGNLFGSNPDARFAEDAMQKLDLVAYLSTTLNTGHAWGRAKETLILPVLPRDEEPQPTTQESMFSFVRLSAGGPSRVAAARSEVSILVEIARRVLGESVAGSLNWSDLHSHSAVRKLIAELIPGLEQIADIDQAKQEFHIPGRDLASRTFPTPSGRAKFQTASLPPPPDGRMRLMTVRSEGQFNSVVYDEEDIYRGQERRDVILLSQVDLDRLGLQPDQRVRVRKRDRRDALAAGSCVRRPPRQRDRLLPRSEHLGSTRRRSAVEDSRLQIGAGGDCPGVARTPSSSRNPHDAQASGSTDHPT